MAIDLVGYLGSVARPLEGTFPSLRDVKHATNKQQSSHAMFDYTGLSAVAAFLYSLPG